MLVGTGSEGGLVEDEATKLLDNGALDCCSVEVVACVIGRPVEDVTRPELAAIDDDTVACDWLCGPVVELCMDV